MSGQRLSVAASLMPRQNSFCANWCPNKPRRWSGLGLRLRLGFGDGCLLAVSCPAVTIRRRVFDQCQLGARVSSNPYLLTCICLLPNFNGKVSTETSCTAQPFPSLSHLPLDNSMTDYTVAQNVRPLFCAHLYNAMSRLYHCLEWYTRV